MENSNISQSMSLSGDNDSVEDVSVPGVQDVESASDESLKHELGGDPEGNQPSNEPSDDNQDDLTEEEQMQLDLDSENDDNEQTEEDTEYLDVPEGFEDLDESIQEFGANLPEELQEEFLSTVNEYIDERENLLQNNAQLQQHYEQASTTLQALDVLRRDFPDDYGQMNNNQLIEQAYDLAQWQQDMKTDPINTFFSILVDQTYRYQDTHNMARDSSQALDYLQRLFHPDNPQGVIDISRHLAAAETKVANHQAQLETRNQRFQVVRDHQHQVMMDSFANDQDYGPAYQEIHSYRGGAETFQREHDWVRQNFPDMHPYEQLQYTTERVYRDMGLEQANQEAYYRQLQEQQPRRTKTRKTGNTGKPPKSNSPYDQDDEAMWNELFNQ